MHVAGRHYAGGWWDWLTPFSILTGVAVVIGYGLLGATWLVMKTDGELREQAYRLSWWLLFAMLGAIVAVSLATPFLSCRYCAALVRLAEHHPHRADADRGGRRHRAAAAQRSPTSRTTGRSFCRWRCSHCPMPDSASACGPISCRRASPSGRPPRRTTASSSCCVGVAILVPIILGYTAWAYWVFRGKVDADSGLSLMPDASQTTTAAGATLAVVRGALARRRRQRWPSWPTACGSGSPRTEAFRTARDFISIARIYDTCVTSRSTGVRSLASPRDRWGLMAPVIANGGERRHSAQRMTLNDQASAPDPAA